MLNKQIFEVSTNTIIKIIVAVLLLWFLFTIKHIIAMIFFAFMLFLIMKPAVDFLKKKKLPGTLAVIIIYFIFLFIFVTVLILLLPPISSQIKQLAQNFPQYWDALLNKYSELKIIIGQQGLNEELTEFLNTLASSDFSFSGIFQKIGDFFQGLVTFLVVMVITFYLLVEEDALRRINRSLLPDKYQPYLNQLFNKIQIKLGWWLRGQLILSLTIFLCVYVALLILQVKYALILAIVAGLLEFVPYLGPIISGSMAVMLTLFDSPVKAIMVIVLYVIIQWLENHILVPKVMQKTVGLNPIVSIIALLVGATVGGVIGVVLAIPVVAAISVFIKDLYEFENTRENINP